MIITYSSFFLCALFFLQGGAQVSKKEWSAVGIYTKRSYKVKVYEGKGATKKNKIKKIFKKT